MSFLFGTVGSPSSTPKKPGGSVGAIQQLSALGLDCLELGWVQSVRVSEITCQSQNPTSTYALFFKRSTFEAVQAEYSARVRRWKTTRS